MIQRFEPGSVGLQDDDPLGRPAAPAAPPEVDRSAVAENGRVALQARLDVGVVVDLAGDLAGVVAVADHDLAVRPRR